MLDKMLFGLLSFNTASFVALAIIFGLWPLYIVAALMLAVVIAYAYNKDSE